MTTRDAPSATGGGSAVPAGGRERLQRTLATVVTAVGIIVLVVGWWGGVDLVTRILPDLASMKANTAVSFILAGVSLHPGVRRRRPRLATAAAAALAVVGGLTWLEYVAGIDLGIDELLARDTNLIATASPGRMGLNTSIAFMFLGFATLSLNRSGVPQSVPLALGAVPAGLSLMAVVAYLLGATSARGLGSATQMAVHTSVMLQFSVFVLGAHLVDRGPLGPIGRGDRPGSLARRLLISLAIAIVGSSMLVTLLREAGAVTDAELQLAVASVLALVAGSLLLLSAARALTRLYDDVAARTRDLEAANEELTRTQAELERLNVELEQRVRRRTAALEASRAELGAFAHSVAHDIRTPLAVLQGFLGTLVGREDLPDAMRAELLQRSATAATRLADMVTDLLAFADETADPTTSTTDLRAAANSAIAALPADADQPTIDLTELPRVRGNRAALQAVLFNLLTNAVKYHHPDRPPVIRIEAVPGEDDHVVVRVIDNGRGIPPADRERVFDLGERADQQGTPGGHGFGLATVRRLVERHHGRVWVEDGIDGGSTFAFTLLRAPDAPDEAAPDH